ncbi:MAG: cytochrome PufQ [Pseudomonadota bacterium]
MSTIDPKSFDLATATPAGALQRRRRAEGWEYRIYFGLIFACSLPLATVRVLMPGARRRAFGIARERRTIWGEARMMANIVTPLIFST